MKLKQKILLGSIVLLSGISAILYIAYNNSSSVEPKAEANMRAKILAEIPGEYSIKETDWIVWSRIFRDSGGILTGMDSWEQFKEASRQAVWIMIMLDSINHMVWLRVSSVQVVYYEY